MQSVVESGELNSEAVTWLVRSEAAACSEEERARLEAWLAKPRHRAAYLRMRAAWSQADQLRRLQPLDGSVNPDLLKGAIVPALRGGHASTELTAGNRSSALRYVLAAMLTALISGFAAWLVAEHIL